MKILIIDNFDSFTYNLYQLVGEILQDSGSSFIIDVYRNNQISPAEIEKKVYDKIIISPGPGNPSDKKYFGVCKEVLLNNAKKIPTLGVCLGMQGIAHYYGGKVVRAKNQMHGKTSKITHSKDFLFKNIPQKISVMRYHSLVVDKHLPKDLIVTAKTIESPSEIMGLRHKTFPIFGVQFHPESFATEFGKQIIENFLTTKL